MSERILDLDETWDLIRWFEKNRKETRPREIALVVRPDEHKPKMRIKHPETEEIVLYELEVFHDLIVLGGPAKYRAWRHR